MSQRKINKRLATTEAGHIALVGRQPRQCKCAWCGKWFADDRPCLTLEQRLFILQFAKESGRSWKKALNDQWFTASGTCESQQIRNNLGPSWLDWFSLARIEQINKVTFLRERISKKLGDKQ